MASSRFFAASDSESETESSDEELTIQTKTTGTKTFMWSDDEEDIKRVVRSEKEKRWDELKLIIKTLKNHKNIKDMQSIQSDFEELCKTYEKSRKVVTKEGVPRFFIRCLVELDDYVNECWEDKEWRKTLNKGNAKGLASVRQKLRKYIRDTNLDNDITAFKENPDQQDEEEEEKGSEEEDELEDEKPAVAQSVPKPAKVSAPKDSDDDEDFDDEFFADETETSSSDDEGPVYLTRDYFLKKRPGDDDQKDKKKERKDRVRQEKKIIQEDEDDDDEGFKVVGGKGILEKPKIFPKDTEITVEAVTKKLAEFVQGRGKKGTDRAQMIELHIELRSIANENNLGLPLDIKLLCAILRSIYDYNPNIATSMKPEMWEKCMAYIKELFVLLQQHKTDLVVSSNVGEEQENLEGEAQWRVRGSVINLVERMDEEYGKMLQACDAHSTEYVDMLQDEVKVCQIIEELYTYMDDQATPEERCRIYLKRIEHIYYKFDQNVNTESLPLMEQLCKYIYDKDDTDRARTRTMLCQIYHLALHDKLYDARDLMLMSHLQDNINAADESTQIMYNRAMVQLGLCAFRKGMTQDAHNCLVDIQSSGRAKELLAQGLLLQRQFERTPEQEKKEKRRLMPFHMHINLELIECVYLVSAMLMEIPYMAAHEFDARRRLISKNFHHVLRVSERQPLLGPPESMREHLVAASKAMKQGDWRTCFNFVINEKMNAKVWDLFQESESVKQQLIEMIKVESLRTYLLSYSQVYDSMSLEILAEMYELPRATVHSTISKMIINDELAASMDEPSSSVIMHRTDPSQMQALALQLSEKVQALVDHNEKLMEMKSGNFFQRPNYQGRDQGSNYQPNRYQSQGGNRYNKQSNNQQGNRYQGKGQFQGKGQYQDRRVRFERE